MHRSFYEKMPWIAVDYFLLNTLKCSVSTMHDWMHVTPCLVLRIMSYSALVIVSLLLYIRFVGLNTLLVWWYLTYHIPIMTRFVIRVGRYCCSNPSRG